MPLCFQSLPLYLSTSLSSCFYLNLLAWFANRNQIEQFVIQTRCVRDVPFFFAVSIVVCEHWMIASLCDVVLVVNAFGNTWCARFFSYSNFSCRCQFDTKPPRNCELRYFYRILHHIQSTLKGNGIFFALKPHFVIVFFSFFRKLWHATHNGIQLSVCKH